MKGPIRASVLTVSDRCSRGEAADTSGPAVCAVLRARLGAELLRTACVPDEPDMVAEHFRSWARADDQLDLIVSTGGTGLSPRDRTPEAARRVFERDCSSLMELARLRCGPTSPRSFLSRGVAGTIGATLIVTLPGSERGAVETMTALLDVLPHAVMMLRGEGHRAGD